MESEAGIRAEPLGNRQAVALSPTNLRGLFVRSRIVLHTQVTQNLRADAVVALVALQPQASFASTVSSP